MSGNSPSDSRVETLADEAATMALGRRIGARLAAGEAVFLIGALGAGKTTLARGAVAAWTGVEEEAPSPTYTLVQTYEGPAGELWHMDLYRLKNADEAFELGVEEAFARAACLVEWPERLAGLAPQSRLDVRLSITDAGRSAELTAQGAWRQKLADL